MQGRDEYEFDYYGGAPYREDYPGGMRQNRYTGYPARPEMMQERPMSPRESCCQSRINELLEEMERFEAMQSEELRRITAEIRRVCGAIDGRGCVAIEGEPDREMIEMLMEQVMDRLDRMPGGEINSDENDVVAVQMGDGWNRRRSLVEALLWQELLRRRMRRKMRGRRRF